MSKQVFTVVALTSFGIPVAFLVAEAEQHGDSVTFRETSRSRQRKIVAHAAAIPGDHVDAVRAACWRRETSPNGSYTETTRYPSFDPRWDGLLIALRTVATEKPTVRAVLAATQALN